MRRHSRVLTTIYFTLVLLIYSDLLPIQDRYGNFSWRCLMDNAKTLKLQNLIIKQLLKEGCVSLLLPDGVTLEIGITQEGKHGDLKKVDDYCYVVASREGKSVMLDSFNLGLRYQDQKDTITYEDWVTDDNGTVVHTLDVV
jgi:hypothetical protein